MSERAVRLNVAEFDRLCTLRGWTTARQRCTALGISPAQYSKVLAGQSGPGAKFIGNAVEVLAVPYGVLFTRQAPEPVAVA